MNLMKAITIWQPYAHAIRLGKKHYETRSWRTNYRGFIVVHAAKRCISTKEKSLIKKYRIPESSLIYGAPVAICKIEDCIKITPEFIKAQPEEEINFGDWKPGRFAWKLKLVRLLDNFRTIRGQQGLWNLDINSFKDGSGRTKEVMNISEIKLYLEKVANVLGNILLKRQIFINFYCHLKPENTTNLFVSWCVQNYRDVLVLNLCKLLEPRKADKKYTLQYFVNFCKEPKNYKMLEKYMRHNRRVYHSGITIDFSREMLELLKSIDFDNDLTEIKNMLEKLKNYRDKCLCHNDANNDNIEKPDIKEMHDFVDKIDKMISIYFKMFRVSYDNSMLQNLKYNNFELFLP